MEPDIFFTITPTERGGFTDQLFQFSCFFKLGLSLRYCYYHRPFYSHRSAALVESATTLEGVTSVAQHLDLCETADTVASTSSFDDVYDFLGFNDFLLSKNPVCDVSRLKLVKLKLGDAVLSRMGAADLEGIQAYIESVVQPQARDKPVLVDFSIGPGRGFLSVIQTSIPHYPTGFSLLSIYREARRKKPWKCFPNRSRHRVVVHIRLGDTAIVRTPWNTYVSLWPISDIAERPVVDYPNFIQTSDFWIFLARLTKFVGDKGFGADIFSDGYKRAFRVLLEHCDAIGWSEGQIALLRAAGPSYDDMEFGIFKAIRGCRLFVGEEEEKLYTLIDACLNAELIVIGPTQRFVPKLIQTFLEPEDTPMVVVLVKRGQRVESMLPRHSHLGLENRSERFFYCDISRGLGDEAAVWDGLAAFRA